MHPVIRIGLLLRRLGHVDSRKKFQKLIHILQTLGAPFPERFALSFYGAYSSDLRSELDSLESEGLILEEPRQGAFPTFTLHPTRKLVQILEEDENLPNPAWLGWAEHLNRKTPQELEGISTVLFLLQRNWPVDQWEPQFKALKPHLAHRYETFQTDALTWLRLAKSNSDSGSKVLTGN